MVRFDLRRREMEDSDAYYKLREDSDDVAISRFRPKRGKTLSARRWRAAFTPEGQLKVDKVLPRIETGGVYPSIRGEVWEFLLGCYSPNSTTEERAALRTFRREQYAKLKAECQAMDPAIGSGLVVTLPRIMEDGGPVQKHMGKSSIIEQVADSRDPIPPAITLHRSADVSGKSFSTTNFLPNHGNDSVDQVVTSLENHSTSVNETNLTDAFATDGDSMGEQAGGIKREKHGTRTSGNKEKDHTSSEANGLADQFTESKIPEIGPLDKRIVQWELLLHQIGLDVVRTDRMLQFYEDPKNLAKLWDVLAVYAWFDEDVGYCQGMSDLCSAMVVLFPDEADAFWCFERLMLRVRENFRCNGPVLGVLKQLAVLGSVIEVVDSRLHRHLEALGGGTYMFALRMLMVLFRREFSFSDTLYLWEMMWASEFGAHTHASQGEQNYRVTLKVVKQEPRSEAAWRRGKAYSSNGKFVRRTIKYGSSKLDKESTPLAVFCAAGILEMNQRKLLKGTQGLDEVVKLLNDTTGKLDAGQACKKALRLYKVYLIKLASQ